MPINYSRYPADWLTVIRPRIMARAQNRCERCGVPHHALIVREPGTDRWRQVDGMEAEVAELVDGEKVTWVVLTIAHIGAPHPDGTPGDKHDKMDCRNENLLALCQRCHLIEDLPDHMRNAAATRRRRQEERGQIPLSLDL